MRLRRSRNPEGRSANEDEEKSDNHADDATYAETSGNPKAKR